MDRYDGNNFCWYSISSRVWQSGYEGFLGQMHSAAELGMAAKTLFVFLGLFSCHEAPRGSRGSHWGLAALVRVAEEVNAQAKMLCLCLSWGCALVSVGVVFKLVQQKARFQCPVVYFDPSAQPSGF